MKKKFKKFVLKKTKQDKPKENVNVELTTSSQQSMRSKEGIKKQTNHSDANLIPYQWKKGRSGNPKGRPLKKKLITSYIRAQLDCRASSVELFKIRALFLNLDPEHSTIGEVVAVEMISKLLSGESAYMKEVMNRVEGVQSALDEMLSPDQQAEEIMEAMKLIKAGKPQPDDK